MANQFIQQAKELTKNLMNRHQENSVSQADIEKAKDAISSAFANSTTAEQEILQQYQKELDALDIK